MVVLLILAGITLTYMLGDHSIFKKAQEAKEKTESGMDKEKGDMNNIVQMIEDAENGGGEEEILPEDKLKEIISKEDGDCFIDEYGNIMDLNLWGYYISEGSSFYIESHDAGYYNAVPAYNFLPVCSKDGELVHNIPIYLKENGKVYELDRLGDWSISYIDSLERVTIPSSCVHIGMGAFNGCKSLKEINLPEGLEYINEYAFQNCKSLEKITFTKGIRSIGYAAFGNCQSLKKVILPEGLNEIEGRAFEGAGVKEIQIPSSVEADIGHEAFENTNILTVTIDSPTVVAGLVPNEEDPSIKPQGGLIENATTIYIKENTTAIGSEVTNKYTKTTSDKTGYAKYIKNM